MLKLWLRQALWVLVPGYATSKTYKNVLDKSRQSRLPHVPHVLLYMTIRGTYGCESGHFSSIGPSHFLLVSVGWIQKSAIAFLWVMMGSKTTETMRR